MKVKDLPKGTNLGGVKVKTPNGVIGHWHSQWGYENGGAGVWLSTKPEGRGQIRIYPQFLDNLKDTLEWEVANDNEEINCNIKTSYTIIDNRKNQDKLFNY